MNPEKETRLVRNVGIVSALGLLVLLVGVSYFFISNQRTEKLVQVEVPPLEEPAAVLDLDSNGSELLYAVAELSRSIEQGDEPTIGEPLEDSPGVYIIDVAELEKDGLYTVDPFGNLVPTGNEIEVVTSDSHVVK